MLLPNALSRLYFPPCAAGQSLELAKYHFAVGAVFQTIPFNLPAAVPFLQSTVRRIVPHSQHDHGFVQLHIRQ